MSLPSGFSTTEEYFEACLSFLRTYRELYWRSNTDVLTENLDFFVQFINRDDNSEDIHELNKFSKTFFEELSRLAPRYGRFTSEKTEEGLVQSPMSQKKAHEVIHLTEEVTNICGAVGCQTVVDLGAGLGYIDYQIFVKTGFNVLGLEGQEGLYVNAKEHQRKYHSETLAKVKYVRHVVSDNSDTNIETYLKDKFPNDNKEFCFMGLHACGDLTVSAMNLFLKMRDSRALIVTPCCYHKMAPATDNIHKFKNFPLSKTLRQIYENFDADTFIDIPFTRMAAQPSCVRDENIQDRVFYLVARALLKVYATKYNYAVKKKRRKPVRLSPLNNNFAQYAEEATTKGFKLVAATTTATLNNEERSEASFNVPELQSMWELIPGCTFTNAALYISFQNHLPAIFENFILYDRLVYLKENGIEYCHYKKVVNEKISPKCLSLFASKGSLGHANVES